MKDNEENQAKPWSGTCTCSCSDCRATPPFHCFISSNGCEA